LGGAEFSLLDTVCVLRQQHPQWRPVLLVPEDGPLAARARELDIEVEIIPVSECLSKLGDSQLVRSNSYGRRLHLAAELIAAIPETLAYSQRLRCRWKTLRPQLIYANGFKAHVFAALSRPPTIPLLCHIHDYVSPRPMMARLFRGYAASSCIVANSHSVANDALSVLGTKRQRRCEVIYNSVDLDHFSPIGRRLDLDELSGLPTPPSGTLRVGLIATMAWWKGHNTFLEAMSRLQKHAVRGYIIGGSIYRTAESENSFAGLHAEALRMGITNRVGFTGHIADVASAIRSLDIVVHASTRPEPFGRSIIEAMSCARPVITTGLGGAAEIVAAGRGTVTFWPGEADDLAGAISKLARDGALRKDLGACARRTAEQHFGRDQLARDLDLLWNRMPLADHDALTQPALKDALVSGI